MRNAIAAPVAAAMPSLLPFRLAGRPLALQGAVVLLGTALLAVCSWISVPMLPVPITMQTFAVTLVGALLGWRLGALTVVLWLAEAAAGLPVLAGGTGGVAVFAGPTAGYLASFPLAAALVGWLAERGGTRSLLRAVAVMALGNALCLVVGGAWLALLIGGGKALAVGVLPFVPGGLLKAALGGAVVEAARRAAWHPGAR
jgi:biotin transport system substrate-specific component